jgi:large subunit ribosomal protein L5
MPKIQQQYKNEVVPALMKELNLSNVMQVPRIEKVVVNLGDSRLSATDQQRVRDTEQKAALKMD